MKIKGSHGGNPKAHLRNLLFLYSVAECSITLQQNGKKSDQIAQTVTLVLTKGHNQLILRTKNAFLK